MAELVDALASGASVCMDVEVRVLSWAPVILANPHIFKENRLLDAFSGPHSGPQGVHNMGVMMKLKGLKKLGQGKWEYRKRIPASAQEAIGKSERKEVIEARSDQDLMRKYVVVVARIDAEIATAKTPKPKLTPRAAWEVALKEAEKLASGVVGIEDPDEARELVAEDMVARGQADAMLVQALMAPRSEPPAYTLQDALDIYLKEKIGSGGGRDHRAATVRFERVMRLAAEAGLSTKTPLSDISRNHARKVRDHMLSREKQGGSGEKLSPASVKKELGMLRTVIGYGSRELGFRDYDNPFHGLPIDGISGAALGVSARDKVSPLPNKVVISMGDKLPGELHHIWRILAGTGCRLGEVTGLRLEDVVVDGSTPHIRIQWHEARRLKTRSSIRSVPLIGDALAATKAAVDSSGGSPFLFSRYARDGGPDAASASVMKHLRGFTTDKRHRVHSLRHRLKDEMRKAGVDKISQGIVLGHAPANIGETYGGEEGLLAVAGRALKAVEGIVR